MKKKIFLTKHIATVAIVLSLSGCGSSDSDRTNTNQSNGQVSKINENNYVKLSKYYYMRKSSMLGYSDYGKEKRSRHAHPGSNVAANSNSIEVNAVTPFNKYVKNLSISSNGVKVVVDINKDANSVNITYENNGETTEKTISFDEFTNINQGLN